MKRKLAGLGLAFALAELAAAYLPPLAVLPTAAFLILLAIFTRRFPKVCLFIGGAAAGCVCFLAFYAQNVAPVLHLAGETVRCVAEVQTDYTSSYVDGMLRGTLRLTQVDGTSTDLLVYCGSFPGWEAGDTFSGVFTLEPLEENCYRMNQQANGVYLQAEYQGEYQALGDSDRLGFVLYRLRMALARRLRNYLPSSLGGIESAMLLGDKSKLTDTVQKNFQLAGVSHLLAISGLHLSLLCGLLSFGGDRSLRFHRPLLLLRGILVVSYMVLTGMPVSVQRAGFVFLVGLVGCFLVQPPDALNSLGLAAIVMGIVCPYAPCDLGFQLSFAGVLGVQLASVLSQHERNLFSSVLEKKNWVSRLVQGGLQVADSLQAATAATFLTTPILVVHGMTTSGVSVLSNLLVVWMLRLALVLGIGLLIVGAIPLLSWATWILQGVLILWLNILYALVRLCAALPMAHLDLPRNYTLWVFFLLGLLGVLFWKCRCLKVYLPVSVGTLALAVFLGMRMERGVIRVALVGNSGNPCSVITQDGRAAVLFRGGAANWNAVKEYLWQHADPQVQVLVDLRQNPSPVQTDAKTTICAEEQPYGITSLTLWETMTLDLCHTNDGNLAVLDAGGYHIAAMTGNVELEQPLMVDAFCAAGAYSPQIQTDYILCTAAEPKWLDSVAIHTYVYTGENPCIVVRPDCSMIFEEVRQLAVQ